MDSNTQEARESSQSSQGHIYTVKLSEDNLEAIETFKQWTKSNAQNGVAYLPLIICENVIKVLDKMGEK